MIYHYIFTHKSCSENKRSAVLQIFVNFMHTFYGHFRLNNFKSSTGLQARWKSGCSFMFTRNEGRRSCVYWL